MNSATEEENFVEFFPTRERKKNKRVRASELTARKEQPRELCERDSFCRGGGGESCVRRYVNVHIFRGGVERGKKETRALACARALMKALTSTARLSYPARQRIETGDFSF